MEGKKKFGLIIDEHLKFFEYKNQMYAIFDMDNKLLWQDDNREKHREDLSDFLFFSFNMLIEFIEESDDRNEEVIFDCHGFKILAKRKTMLIINLETRYPQLLSYDVVDYVEKFYGQNATMITDIEDKIRESYFKYDGQDMYMILNNHTYQYLKYFIYRQMFPYSFSRRFKLYTHIKEMKDAETDISYYHIDFNIDILDEETDKKKSFYFNFNTYIEHILVGDYKLLNNIDQGMNYFACIETNLDKLFFSKRKEAR